MFVLLKEWKKQFRSTIQSLLHVIYVTVSSPRIRNTFNINIFELSSRLITVVSVQLNSLESDAVNSRSHWL